ncbi:PREDICTED: translin-associated protein X isoform X2 [Nicrophorus vespilloides]|uniref:Translin-associated protein X isoform X2 n=1 Tax=Nicrophorus vespilloides TaxID=110193 RepID=A0ABM1MZT0_NICVS|nr:PREDICTED: translin-associated protein X isoform X2 [Nicrophorus vespilloides]
MPRRKEKKYTIGHVSQEVILKLGETHPTIMMFQNFSQTIDDKHQRYERVVKLGRDLTYNSKNLISFLQVNKPNTEYHSNAKEMIAKLIEKYLKPIAVELDGHDHYQYLRAYTNGLQEFTEAILFHQYLENGVIENWSVVNDYFTFKTEDEKELKLLFPQMDFILGLADCTGELMRKCINNIAVGLIDDCFKICNFVKFILTGFLGVIVVGRNEIGRKLYTLKQSLMKMEMVCYNIKMRGNEVPKHMLADVSDVEEEDEESMD